MERKDEAKNVEVIGRIKAIKGKGHFIIHTVTMNRDFDCNCNFFCPVQEGDAICAICLYIEGSPLQVIRPPFVTVPVDRDSIINTFCRILRGTAFGNIKANRLFDSFATLSGGAENVGSYLNELAENYVKRDRSDITSDSPIPELSVEQSKTLLNWWYKNRDLRRLWLLGLTNKEINECHLSTDKIYQKCITNPFTVPAIPLEKCIEILQKQGKGYQEIDIQCGKVVRSIYHNLNQRGWSGTPMYGLLRSFPELANNLEYMKEKYSVVVDMDTIYLERAYQIELKAREYIAEILSYNTVDDTSTELDSIERPSVCFRSIHQLSDDQIRAVQGAMDHPLAIITGGAGTGKTTIIAELVHNLEIRHLPYLLCSFTGKAVSRIKVVVNRNSVTIHRFLSSGRGISGESGDDGGMGIIRNKKPFVHVVIDEASMITVELFVLLYERLKRFYEKIYVTFVGDDNQLPPISWGALMKELLKSHTVPVYRLLINHRVYTAKGELDGVIVNSEGMIDYNTNRLNGIEEPPFELTETANFMIIDATGLEKVTDIINGFHRAGVKIDKFCIITPYNKDLDELNKMVQQIYNDGKSYTVDVKNKVWMVGDRVIMLENNYDINVMNGEEGIVKEISNKAILVDFAGMSHEFSLKYNDEYEKDSSKNYTGDTDPFKEELSVKMLAHAFAITVHKSQGSEWDFIIFYFPSVFNKFSNKNGTDELSSFLNFNMVNVAITRTKRACWCVGDREKLNTAAVKLSPYRHENLHKRLKSTLPLIPERLVHKLRINEYEELPPMDDDYCHD